MIREILFVHHSHTDIGYTHPQPVVLELHRGFIDQAIEFAEQTADYPDDAKFRWTCEVTGVTEDWWKHADSSSRDRFLAAVSRGQIEVAAMRWNMTPLMDHAMLLETLKPVAFFRDLGVPVRAAMNTDINGLPWGAVDALLDHGIEGVSMSINEHYGHAMRPWPAAFNWESPGGRSILAYNGLIYGATSDHMLRIPHSIDEARSRIAHWMGKFAAQGYQHPFLMMQITNLKYHDNASPQRTLPDFIQEYNARAEAEGGVRLRMSTPSEVFDRFKNLAPETLPTLRGDWTDWWNFGAGSTARETAMGMRGQRDLRTAQALDAVAKRPAPARRDMLVSKAREQLALFAEHTWGTDRSISRPGSDDTRSQQLMKLATAAEGGALARLLRRDAMQNLCVPGEGTDQTVLVANPHPFPVTQSVRLPALPPFAEPPTAPRQMGVDTAVPGNRDRHLAHRQDVLMSDLPDSSAFWSQPIQIPPLSHVFLPASDVAPAEADNLYSTETSISNGLVTLELDRDTGGVTSVEREGREFSANFADDLRFGVPVAESIATDDRDDMFGPIDNETPDWNRSWKLDWPAKRVPGRLTETVGPDIGRGQVSLSQVFELPGGDRATVTYRLTPQDPTIGVTVRLEKAPNPAPNSVYLPLTAALADNWECDFETAGAVVALDAEQLPFSSRHYVTAQNYIRIADPAHEMAVSCPDAPLWQIGGYTFGRFDAEDGTVARENPVLLAWLANNYWSTNFQADQSGDMTFDFSLSVGSRRSSGQALQWATACAIPPGVQLCDEDHGGAFGVQKPPFDIDMGDLLATSVERDGDGRIALTVMNPGDRAESVHFQSDNTMDLTRTNHSGAEKQSFGTGQNVSVEVAPREWCRIVVNTNDGMAAGDDPSKGVSL
ncbi:hypothetical protein OU789_16235 [Halocynthiibacter sp. C4]|uniref:glycoside hydrolase family 38 N-terminal domain-containing protein n=1 Tax=Halocynthiibacter sp. C4 TaxID=2992758 RepID=UPI00237B3BDE|nr:hypothetical protein [Halocynthiibacter sp. C4]MDE0591488.1 hypothetical protein [Halocynthiibacter sp. C4]